MSHNALAHAAPETARDAAEGGEELAAPDAGTKPSSDGRGLQLLVETQTAAMADLLREMRETNRLLNVIATQASQTLGSQPIPVTSLSVDASSRGHEADDTKPLPRPPIDDKITASLQERAKHLTETCFQSACFLGHRRAINLREAFVQHVERQVVGDTLQYQIHLHTRTKTTVWVRVEGRVRSVPLIWWAYPSKLRRLPRSSTHFHRRDPGPEEGALPTLWATSVNSTWPLQPALECELGWSVPSPHPHTNFGNLRIAPASLDHYRTFIGLALCCGPAGRLFPAELTRTEPDKAYTLAGVGATADLLSPGSLWHFPVNSDRLLMDFHRLALVSTILSADRTSPQLILRILHRFFAPWATHSPLANPSESWEPPHPPVTNREGESLHGKEETRFYIHSMRCFHFCHASSAARRAENWKYEGVGLDRGDGQFSSPTNTHVGPLPFCEHRMTVIYRWTIGERLNKISPFRVLVLSDGWLGGHSLDTWEDRGFFVRSHNAGYHLVQATIHTMLLTWAQHWSGCLDLLDKSVKVELGELANEDTSNDLMFDNSFGRSKAYFKALQILRIFADAIRETGRGVRGMSPEKLAWATHSKPDEDLDLLNNWKILWTSYLEAETRLLSRIAGKTEEIKGLRDGMFNATSLREASRSTTMNRYVIVFTIVTLLYLPPSLVATVFGTQLFDSGDPTDNISRFRTSTISVSIGTYILGVLLIFLADRLDLPRAMYGKAVAVLLRPYDWIRPIIRIWWGLVRKTRAFRYGSRLWTNVLRFWGTLLEFLRLKKKPKATEPGV